MVAIAIALLLQPMDLANLEDAYVVDVRSAAAYAEGHIPGAVNVDVASFSEKRGGATGLLKPLDALRPLVEQAGLSPDRHVVVYATSAKSTEDFRDATRLFWILEYLGFPRVSVLDGGFARWQAEGRAIETRPVTPTPTSLPDLKPREELRANAEEVAEAVKSDEVAVLDVRSPEEFAGEKKNDVVAKAGHVPGAQNLPSSEMLDAVKNAVKPENADKELSELGVKPDKPVITYCNTGRQASVGYFTLRLLGRDNVALYDGSMSDWTVDPDRPVEQGMPDTPKE
ncbi:MAG: sulfurtransferase [FCB group bacterium]|jgi:thiosulfate/3-mercaptopyruvate sulfurtransferase|nr:sulfurtransferase [FCB group bacterium]